MAAAQALRNQRPYSYPRQSNRTLLPTRTTATVKPTSSTTSYPACPGCPFSFRCSARSSVKPVTAISIS